MKKYKLPVRFTGQHFTIDTELIEKAIKIAAISHFDIVIDIGAGKGNLTAYLAMDAAKVIAIENDRKLIAFLKRKFIHNKKILIYSCDFRHCKLPEQHFKVVSNIPFRLTAFILKRLMYDFAEYFNGGVLIMQAEPAYKLISKKPHDPWKIFYRCFFDFQIVEEIAPESFSPPPTVNCAMVRIRKKINPDIEIHFKSEYINFLSFVFKQPEAKAGTVLKQIFRNGNLRSMSKKCGINTEKKVMEINFRQWPLCFNVMISQIPEKFHPK